MLLISTTAFLTSVPNCKSVKKKKKPCFVSAARRQHLKSPPPRIRVYVGIDFFFFSHSREGGTSAQKFHQIGRPLPWSLQNGDTGPRTEASVASDSTAVKFIMGARLPFFFFPIPLNKEAREEKGIGERASWRRGRRYGGRNGSGAEDGAAAWWKRKLRSKPGP